MSEERYQAEVVAEEMLRAMGFEVTPVATGTERSVEFLVDGDGRGYVVEVKTRENRLGWKGEIHRGEIAMESRSVGWSNWAKDAPPYAVKQMRSTDPKHSRWWVLWVSVEVAPTGETAAREVFGSLYGACEVAFWEDGEEPRQRTCLYLVRGVFERHPELCGCVVVVNDRPYLAINGFAEDRDGFQNSRLCRLFAVWKAVVTEATLLLDSGFVAIQERGEVDRADEESIAAYLQTKYNVKQVIVLKGMNEYSATTRIPAPEQ